jgi:hypothetical protein
VQAVLELIAARVDGDQLRFMVARRACPSGIDPDDIAAEGMEALFPGLAAETVVLHSTSWRYENGVLALTYLGYSDQLSSDALPLTLAREAKPNGDDATSVVAHAIRHLAFLTRTEPEKYAKPLSAETLAFLGTIQPDVAGRIHHREQAA